MAIFNSYENPYECDKQRPQPGHCKLATLAEWENRYKTQAMRRVVVHPPNPQWGQDFQVESTQVAKALGDNAIAIHHIGSTAIPQIYAKPVIDLLVEVRDIALVDGCNGAMASLGYLAMGEYGLPGRRYFRKDNAQGDRTHHVHIFQTGSPEITRHLAFRNYMIAHPEAAQQYSHLKRTLAQQHPQDIQAYMDGKDNFVKTMEQKALAWINSQG